MVNVADCQKWEDEKLVGMAIEDGDYFYCLMQRYEEKLKKYVRRLTYLADEDSDDIVQEAFISAYQHLNDCDCDLKFSSWMYRITHNRAINFLKKSRKNLRVVIEEGDDEFVGWLTAGTNIERETMAKDLSEEISRILAKLKPDYKEVLVLKFFEDKDYKEMSDILQKPMGTVATLISRAKIEFKKIYEKENK